MGYPENTFLVPRVHQPSAQTEAPPLQAESALAEEASTRPDERIHTRLTAAVFLGIGIVARLFGLHLAPVACVIFSIALLAGDA